MITHKEAIDLLEDIKDEYNQEKVDKVIELLDNGIWHDYSKEKPKIPEEKEEPKTYLLKCWGNFFNKFYYHTATFNRSGHFYGVDDKNEKDFIDIREWREIPEYEDK